jgi:nucleotide-binding universal stress UspA family protein
MYDTILVTLDSTPSDRAIIEHVKQLAKLANSRLVLLHVADGWAARTYGPDAVSPEIAEDTTYLEKSGRSFNPPASPPRRSSHTANRSKKSSSGSSGKGAIW